MEFRDGAYWDGDFFLVDWDDFTKRAVWIRDLGDAWEVRTDYHMLDSALDSNAEFAKADAGKKMGDWVRIASVPQFILDQNDIDEKLRQGDKKALSRFFNDSSNRRFRTRDGKF